MARLLKYADIDFDETVCSETILETKDDVGFAYFVETDLKEAHKGKQKTKCFPPCPKLKKN